MPQATLRAKTNAALMRLSEQHPETQFTVLGAWPREAQLRVLIETRSLSWGELEQTLSAISSLTDVERRHIGSEMLRFEVSTPTPPSHGAMAESGVVPTFPLRLENGWFVGELTASQEQLISFRDELDAAGIEYDLVRVTTGNASTDGLTGRQREVINAAVEHGYYALPRRCTLQELAARLDISKSVLSRILRRAERHIITTYCSD